MKSLRMFFFAAMVLFLCVCPARGTIEFNDGLIHDIDYYTYEDVWVDYQTPAMYTTVNWLDGGQTWGVLVGYEQSRINIRGGSIHTLYSWQSSQLNISGGDIYSTESGNSSQIDITGGAIDHLSSYDSSQVNISGGAFWDLSSYDSSQVDISGGSITRLYSSDSSQVNFSGGSTYFLDSYGSSKVNFSGGSIAHLSSWDSSQVDISGGSIGGDLILYRESMIQIFGSDFAVDGLGVGYGELTSIYGGWPNNEPWRHLTGTLLSGELIDTGFRIGHEAKIVLIPEPATVLLLGLGGLLLRRRK